MARARVDLPEAVYPAIANCARWESHRRPLIFSAISPEFCAISTNDSRPDRTSLAPVGAERFRSGRICRSVLVAQSGTVWTSRARSKAGTLGFIDPRHRGEPESATTGPCHHWRFANHPRASRFVDRRGVGRICAIEPDLLDGSRVPGLNSPGKQHGNQDLGLATQLGISPSTPST